MGYIVDNVNQVSDLLVFKKDSKDIYYFIQIIRRRKDNPDQKRSEINLGRWFIKSIEELDIQYSFIKDICKLYNARAYISLTPRSLAKLGKECLLEYSNRIIRGDYNNIQYIPEKVALSPNTCQSRGVLDKPRWIIDLDSNNISDFDTIMELFRDNYITLINTPGGYHIVIKSFNIGNISKYKKGKSDDYEYKGVVFTLRKECNTILFAYKS